MKTKIIYTVCAMGAMAWADTLTWKGGGANNNWSTAANWTSDGSHTIPQNGDSVSVTLKYGTECNNDLTGLSLAHLEFGMNPSGSGPKETVYCDFKGNQITLTGGANAFKAIGSDNALHRLRNYIPFYLAEGEQVFNCYPGRLHQYGEVTGLGKMVVTGENNLNYFTFYGECKSAGGTIIYAPLANFKSSAHVDFGDNSSVYAAEGVPLEIDGNVYIRMYGKPVESAIVLRNQSARVASGLHSANFVFNQMGQGTFNGAISGDTLYCYTESSRNFVFNNTITMTDDVIMALNNSGGSMVASFYGKVTAPAVNRRLAQQATYGSHMVSLKFNASSNEVDDVYMTVGTLTLGAEDALPNTTIHFTQAPDSKQSTINLNGKDQVITGIAFDGGFGAGDVGATSDRIVTSSTAATLTLTPSENMKSDLRFDGAMSLTWQPSYNNMYTTLGTRVNAMSGTLKVNAGTFIIGGGHSFPNVTAIEVASGAKLKYVSSVTDKFGNLPNITLADGAKLELPEGMTISATSLVIGGVAQEPNKYYTGASTSVGDVVLSQLVGEGKIFVKAQGGETVSAEWTGANGTSTADMQNWKDTPESLPMGDGTLVPQFVAVGSSSTAAEIASPVAWKGMLFDAPQDFTLSGASISLGEAGVSVADSSADLHHIVSAPVIPSADSTITLAPSGKVHLDFAGGMYQEPGGALYTLTKNNPGIWTIQGGDFLGDIVVNSGMLRIVKDITAPGTITTTAKDAHVRLGNVKLQKAIKNTISGNAALQIASGCTASLPNGITQTQQLMDIYAEKNTSLTIGKALAGLGSAYVTFKSTQGGSVTYNLTSCLVTAGAFQVSITEGTPVVNMYAGTSCRVYNYITLSGPTVMNMYTTNALGISPVQLSNTATLNLNGYDQTMGRLSWAGGPNDALKSSIKICSATPATLSICHNNVSGSGSNRGEQMYYGKIEGKVSILKSGDQKLLFGNTIDSEGSVGVTEGTLTLASGEYTANGAVKNVCCKWAKCTGVSASGTGVLEIQSGADVGKKAVFTAEDDGQFNLASGVAIRVADLYVNGQKQGYGTYTKANCSAIIGDGCLIVPSPATCVILR